MSTTTMEEVFKEGWSAGKFETLGDTADEAWEKYRYNQLLKVSGKDVADDWLKARYAPDKKPENLKCPECEGEMVERSSQYGKFWGCRNYPRCKGTRDSEGLSKAEKAAQRNKNDHEDVGPDSVQVRQGDGFSFKKG